MKNKIHFKSIFTIVLSLVSCLIQTPAQAKEKCEKVGFKGGSDCNSLSVWIDLSDCQGEAKDKLPLKVSCNEKSGRAEGQTGSHTYSVKIKQVTSSSGAWGTATTTWMANKSFKKRDLRTDSVAASAAPPENASRGLASIRPDHAAAMIMSNQPAYNEVTSISKSSPSPIPSPIPVSIPISHETPAPSPSVTASPLPASTDTPVSTATPEPVLKLSGFLDAQYQGSSNSDMHRGFLLNDGALYLTWDLAKLDFKIDLPFRMYTQNGPDFQLGLTKAQAFVGQKYESGFRWKIGQFDTTFGFEGNDTVDIVFSRQGNVYNFTDPFVHTGILLGYDFNADWGLNAYIADPNDRGILQGKDLQFGLQLVKASQTFRFAPGLLVNRDFSTQQYNYEADLVAGVTLGKLAIDGEINYNSRNDIINPETGTGIRGIGALLQVQYSINDDWNIAVRPEYITQQAYTDPKSTATQTLLKSQVLVFVGPQYNINKYIRLRLDYSYQQDTQFITNTSLSYHGFNLGAVFKF